jgi:xanthine dehydrogenase YagS FAD-binding subunit
MKLGVEKPTTLVDINPLRERDASLTAVTTLPNGGIRLGALAHMSDVAWNPAVHDGYPLVSQALLLAASGQIRNMATMGGNILQRTRCPYFRDTASPCNKREPGSGCSAIGGFNRTHAILGGSDHCIATHPSDLAVAFTALDAVVHVRGTRERAIPFADFHLLPGSHPERETILKPGEIVTAIDLPPLPYAKRSLYLKVRDRASYAFALASAAVALDVQNGTVRSARVALGGVGTGRTKLSVCSSANRRAATCFARPRKPRLPTHVHTKTTGSKSS